MCLDANVPIFILCLHSLSIADTKCWCWHKVELIYSHAIISSPVELGDNFPLSFKHFSFFPFSTVVRVCEHIWKKQWCQRWDRGQRALLGWWMLQVNSSQGTEAAWGPRAPCTHRELLAFQLLSRISAKFLHQLDDLIKLMRHVFTTFSHTRQ